MSISRVPRANLGGHHPRSDVSAAYHPNQAFIRFLALQHVEVRSYKRTRPRSPCGRQPTIWKNSAYSSTILRRRSRHAHRRAKIPPGSTDAWVAWCAVNNNTTPWRLTSLATTTTDQHREAVLQAGFVRFCHIRQSARPRGGRNPVKLPSSPARLLKRYATYERCTAIVTSPCAPRLPLLTAQVRRLLFEYKATHGVADLILRRREPFTRHIQHTR